MTDFIDVETARDPEGREFTLVPDGFVLCLIPKELADGEWRECCAIRIVADEDGTVARLEATNDMDWLTAPEADNG